MSSHNGSETSFRLRAVLKPAGVPPVTACTGARSSASSCARFAERATRVDGVARRDGEADSRSHDAQRRAGLLVDRGSSARRVWATKTALLMELATASLRGPAYAPESHFHAIFEQPDRPPDGVQVWLIAVNAHPERRLATSFGGWMEDTNRRPTGYFHTFHVGGLGFQVLGQTRDGHVADLPPLTVPPPVRPFLLDAWPTSSSASWPPEGIVMELEHLRILAGWPSRLICESDWSTQRSSLVRVWS